jgi:hypothetical protein
MRFRRSDRVDDQLRKRHRGAPDAFVDAVADEIPPAPRRVGLRSRTGLALALSVAALGMTSALGGVGYAKSAAHQVVATMHSAISAPSHATTFASITPADGQYCHGDDCHHHHHHHHHHHLHHHHHHHHKKHHHHRE